MIDFRNEEGLITHNIDMPVSYQRLYLLSKEREGQYLR